MFDNVFNIWTLLIIAIPLFVVLGDKKVTGHMGMVGKIIAAELTLLFLSASFAYDSYAINTFEFFICYQSSVIIAIVVYIVSDKKDKDNQRK